MRGKKVVFNIWLMLGSKYDSSRFVTDEYARDGANEPRDCGEDFAIPNAKEYHVKNFEGCQ